MRGNGEKVEAEKYSREEKSNPLQCISGASCEGVGAPACGERKSRFEKMKFAAARLPLPPVSIFMCVRSVRVFHGFHVVGLFLS